MIVRIALCLIIGLGVVGCAGPALAKDLPGPADSAGHKIYIAKCAKCHKFYDPAKYSEADWEKWMTKMSKKAKLKPDQAKELSRYISEYFRPPNGTNATIPEPLKR